MPYEISKHNRLVLTLFGTLAIAGVLIGCYFPQTSQSSSPVARKTPSQILDITATTTLANQLFDLEVAQKPRQQELGLMHRTFMPPNRGMLFPFKPARVTKFWMKNCLMSLDIIFVRQGKIVAIAPNVPPCKQDPCPIYGPDELVDQVIEVKNGRTQEIGLKVGSKVEIQWLPKPKSGMSKS
jgi:uncharacterized protein